MKLKKRFSFLLLSAALSMSFTVGYLSNSVSAKGANNKLAGQQAFNGGKYKIRLSKKVRVKVGGAVKELNSDELNHNQKIGRHTITPETFRKLKSSLPETYTFKVNPRRLGALQEIYLSADDDVPKKGLFNWKTRQFLFAKLDKPIKSPDGKGGLIKGTSVKGRISKNQKKIRSGEFTSGFIAGTKGFVVSAEATFFFTGERI